jgi:hypothetical protein
VSKHERTATYRAEDGARGMLSPCPVQQVVRYFCLRINLERRRKDQAIRLTLLIRMCLKDTLKLSRLSIRSPMANHEFRRIFAALLRTETIRNLEEIGQTQYRASFAPE